MRGKVCELSFTSRRPSSYPLELRCNCGGAITVTVAELREARRLHVVPYNPAYSISFGEQAARKGAERQCEVRKPMCFRAERAMVRSNRPQKKARPAGRTVEWGKCALLPMGANAGLSVRRAAPSKRISKRSPAIPVGRVAERKKTHRPPRWRPVRFGTDLIRVRASARAAAAEHRVPVPAGTCRSPG